MLGGWIAIGVAVGIALVGRWFSRSWFWAAVLLAAAGLGYAMVQGVAWRQAVLDP